MKYKLTWTIDYKHNKEDFEKDFDSLGDVSDFIRSVALLKNDCIDSVYIIDIKSGRAFEIIEMV
jgi:hypothetical protein